MTKSWLSANATSSRIALNLYDWDRCPPS